MPKSKITHRARPLVESDVLPPLKGLLILPKNWPWVEAYSDEEFELVMEHRKSYAAMLGEDK